MSRLSSFRSGKPPPEPEPLQLAGHDLLEAQPNYHEARPAQSILHGHEVRVAGPGGGPSALSDPLQLLAERRYVVADYVPDDVERDAEVVVDDPVAHPGYVFPRYVRMGGACLS